MGKSMLSEENQNGDETKTEGDTPNGDEPEAEPGAANTADGDSEDIKEEEKESKSKEAKWTNFPEDISRQIEALYCHWKADLRRPGQLVECKVNGIFPEKEKT